MPITAEEAKRAAKVLEAELRAISHEISHSRALELVAHQFGHSDWNTASSRLSSAERSDSGVPIPVLRIQDWQTAHDFYVDYLDFTVQWEHRFEPGLPIYARLAKSETVLDLSEHYGDGTPGSGVWIPVADIEALHTRLIAKENKHSRPGVNANAPGGPTMTVVDPFSNMLHFCQPK